MAIWIQSLSWTLIYALGQGFVVYASLWIVLKLMPSASANAKYHLSLSALTVLLGWFVATWWHQYDIAALANNAPGVLYGFEDGSKLPLIQQVDNGAYRQLLQRATILLPWLSVCYIAGLMLMVARLCGGMLQLSALRRNGLSQPDSMLDDMLCALKKKVGFDGSVRLLISVRAQVPMVVGFLKPMILMPAAAVARLTTEQLEAILLHELAHIKRYDYLVNILQAVVETVLFFNPFVWLISSVTRREREHCCDDLVLLHTRQPLYYATALATLADGGRTAPALTVAASGQSNHLFHRIERIMELKKNPFSYSRMVAAVLIIAVMSGAIVWLTPSFAATKKEVPVKEQVVTEPAPACAPDPEAAEKALLVKRLSDARLIDEVQGFVLEKTQSKLFIDGVQLPDAVAGMYLMGIKQEIIRIQVNSFSERLKQHPEASLLQLMAPMTFSSGCVDYGPSSKKPGC